MEKLNLAHKKLCDLILSKYRDADDEPNLTSAHPYLNDVQVNAGMCNYFMTQQDTKMALQHAKAMCDAISKINSAPVAYTPSLKRGEYACPFKESVWFQSECKPILVELLAIAQQISPTQSPESTPATSSKRARQSICS